MTRINNLYDLHKNREALITKDCKSLIIIYEMSYPTGLHKLNRTKKKTNTFFQQIELANLEVKGNLEFTRDGLKIKLTQEEEDFEKLYNILLTIAYLLGSEIKFYYQHKDFPYGHIPNHLNFGDYSFNFQHRRKLIESPEKYINCGYSLLQNEDSYFSRITEYILHINTIKYPKVRFFFEFSALKHLSQEINVSGAIFESDEAKDELKDFSNSIEEEIKDKLSEFEKLKENDVFVKKIDRIINSRLNVGNLNHKATSKYRMKEFIRSLNHLMHSYEDYVDDWHDIRSNKIAHGNILKGGKELNKKDIKKTKKLHSLIGEIVYNEFKNNNI